jgi:GMP synthase (glutamine-hydrolysing)
MMRVRYFLVGMIVMFVVCAAVAVASNIASPPQTPRMQGDRTIEASSTWIVVNMFTGRSSKQAEKVREILTGLGAGGQGIVLPYSDITLENMRKIRPAFLALSPNGIPWCRYKGKNGIELENFFKALKTIIEEMNIPMIGICGGHQALAIAFGGKVGPIRGGEDDCFPYGDNPTERGRHNIFVTEKDPLFDGMGASLNLVQNHYDEVKRLPAGFMCLAENKLCKYQVIKHPAKPAYGVQAHTEYFMKHKPDGGILLKNFLNIAKEHNRIWRSGSMTREQAPADPQPAAQTKTQTEETRPW